ncbi:hypothetical protein QBZ16_002652 [Prototheca wickerhamii]|uniref:HTH HARE-type domain-containing protein n=1 Tax=Prototheca wickerhamii TaxID=3111 RepID=A0AAD9MIV8_PROWI|nr:hypothetical protein QBZ16_002652 [Prototheca wickerhamii]
MFSPFCSKAHPEEAPYSAIPTPLAGDALGSGGGGIFKQAAVEVLRAERRLMPTGEIARLALLRGLVRATGKTPEATMASALYTDIKRREGTSIFIRPHEGLFGLREWLELGIEFRDDYAEELARRAAATYGPYSALGLAPGAGFHPAGLAPTSLGARTPPCEAAGPSSASGGSGGLMDLLDAAEMELKRSGSGTPERGLALGVEERQGDSMPREDASQCPGRQNPAETAVELAATEQPHEADPGSTLSAPQNATDPTGAERDELRIEICRAEARVRSLELELGALHPGVGRALIEAARLQTRAAELGLFPDAIPSCRQLADAALVRASQIMVAWQEALGRSKGETQRAFAALLGDGA